MNVLSGLKVGFADFSKATKLLTIKLGDASEIYENSNLKEFYAGNNTLLHTVDLRNCNQLAQAIDLSGCTNIEYVYLDGTVVTGCKLPSGGILKVLHLPSTITGLEIIKQPKITDLVIPDYSNIATLRLEYVGDIVDSKSILSNMVVGGRVRIIGFNYTFESVSAINTFYDLLDTMRGLDENGNNVDKAQLMGTIHIDTITGSEMAALLERYPNISITYNHISSYLYYYNYDGTSLLFTETITDGGDGVYIGTPSRNSTAQYSYTFAGWSRTPNGEAEEDARLNVEADRNIYAAYTATIRTYSVYFVNSSSGSNVTLQTVSNVPYGGNALYTETTPVDAENGMDFLHWNPEPTNITGDTTCYAVFESPLEVAEISDSWADIIASVNDGTYTTKYKVGNYKPIDLGSEGIVNMQIAAKNKDELADGSGNAPITWVAKELLTTKHRMNPQIENVYSYSNVVNAWIFNDNENNKSFESETSIGNGEPSSENNYMAVNCSFTITASDNQDITFKMENYFSSGSSSEHYVITNIDGEDNKVAGDSSSVTKTLTAGQTMNITLKYITTSNSYWYKYSSYVLVKLSSTTNNFVVNDFTTDTANTREQNGYKEGTGAIGGWEKCDMRKYLKETIKPLIPEEVRNAIKEVKKYSTIINISGTKVKNSITNDDIWLLGDRELNINNISGTLGASYKVLFPDDNSRIRGGEPYHYRDAESYSRFYIVNGSGRKSYDASYYKKGVLIGFCM